MGEYQQAETNLFLAIEALESVRQPELKDDQKISIFETQSKTYYLLQQALIAQNKIDKALEIAERSRGRALVDLLASKLPDSANKQSNKLPSIQLIKQIAKQQSSTLVQYSLMSEFTQVKGKQSWQQKLYIWIVKPTGEIGFKKVNIESLNKPLQAFIASSRDSLGVRSSSMFDIKPVQPSAGNSKEQLQQLYKILIAPIADSLPKDPNARVIFIPQGVLFSVPFPALLDAQGKYLIEKHTILTAPSIQVLDLTSQQSKGNGNVLVVGNPTMPKIKVGELEENFKPLPGSEQEAYKVAQLFNVEALTGNKANKATVVEKMKTARVIHLATHGILDDFKGFGIPGAIVLAPDGKRDDTIDGILTAGEIFEMKLRADLVVLSACDTGNGTVTGDGVVGLSRSLLSAGARSVVVSLWEINDNSTGFLMTQFYRNLQQNPDKAVALRQAMLTTMQQKEYSSPKYWAAFTLIGEAE